MFVGARHAKTGFGLGGTVRELLARAPCSLWIQSTPVKPIRRILAPIDFSPPSLDALRLAVSLARTGAMSPWLFENHPMGTGRPPAGYSWSLGLLYLVWLAVVMVLYFACRWYAGLKSRRRDWWLSYL